MRVWVASGLFYAEVFLICEVLRWIVPFVFPKPAKSLTVQLFLEFIGTLQICTPMFDVGTVLDTYGLFGVFVEIAVIELANSYFLRDCVASPCPIVTSCYRGRKALKRAVCVIVVQMAGAFASFYLSHYLFSLGLHPIHLEVAQATGCTSDLTVSLTIGAAIEGAAVILGKAVEKVASERYVDSWQQRAVNSLFSGFICALGINLTGLYGNPIVASACTFNCLGITHFGHLAVYWISPILAWYVAEGIFGEDGDEEEPTEDEDKLKKKE